MWLPRPVYESLPYLLMLGGLVLALAGYFVTSETSQSVLLVCGSLLAVVGLVLALKRRDYRLSRSRVKYDRLD